MPTSQSALRAAALAASALAVFAAFQDPEQPVQEPAAPQAAPADVESVDAIVTALYDVISGPAGQKRDWDRLRSLFHEEARMLPLGPVRGSKGVAPSLLLPEDYVRRAGPSLEKNGFYEQEIHRRVERFGHLAHVFTSYEARATLDDEKPMFRGVNAIELVRSGGRWWITSLAWEQEREAGEWPARYRRDAEFDARLAPEQYDENERPLSDR